MLTIVPASIPYVIQGYGGQFTDDNLVVKAFFYDNNAQLLYTILPDNQFNIFVNVPAGVARAFNYTHDADDFYQHSINGYYHPVLLTEGCGPLLTEDGSYLLAR